MTASPRTLRVALLLGTLIQFGSLAVGQTTTPVWGVPVAVRTGDGSGSFFTPYAVVVDSQGNTIVADTGNQLVEVIRADGGAPLTYGQPGPCGMDTPDSGVLVLPPPGCFSQARSVAVDASDLIYVADWANNFFVVFNSVSNTLAASSTATRLVPLARFGTTGGPDWNIDQNQGAPGELEGPVAVAIDRGPRYNNTSGPNGVNRVFILDQNNNRIQSWDCDAAKLQSSVPATAAAGCTLTTLQIGGPGPDSSGHTPGYFDAPWGFGLDQTTGDIAVAEYNDSLVDVYRYPFSGSLWGYATSIQAQGADPGSITSPEDVKFHAGAVPNVSDLWVTDYGNNRVQVFQQNGSNAPTLRFQPLSADSLSDHTQDPMGVACHPPPQTQKGAACLEMIGPQALEFNPITNHVLVVDQGNNRLEEWAAAGLTVTTSLPTTLSVGSIVATITVTNSGAVSLSNVVPAFANAVGVSQDHGSSIVWPPAAVSLAPGDFATFHLPLSILRTGIFSFSVSASGTHQFSGAIVTSPASAASGTSAAALNPSVTSGATVAPTPKVFHGAVICVTVTANNGGSTQLDSQTLSIVPTNAVAIPAASAPASCPANALTKTTPLSAPPLTPNSTQWTEPFTAGASGTASFLVKVSAVVHGTNQVITAVDTTASTEISADMTAPTMSMTVAPKFPGPGVETAANAAGWWNTVLQVKFHAADDTAVRNICFDIAPTPIDAQPQCIDTTTSPQLCNASRTTCDVNSLLTLDYSGRYKITYTATDDAGNTFSNSGQVNLDLFAPNVNFTNPTPVANSHGWNNTAITWTIVPSDDLSGVASVTFGGALLTKPQVTINQQGYGVQATVIVTDNAGNSAAYSSPVKNIDFIPPTMTPLVTGNTVTFPVASSSYPNGQTDAAPPAVTLPPGITVTAFKASDVDPAMAPPAVGLPADGPLHTWTLCDNAGNCSTIGFGAELVNAFDLTLKTDAMYTRWGTTGHQPAPLVPGCFDPDHDNDCDVALYKVVDANGNGIFMLENVEGSNGTEVHVDVAGFTYVSGCPTNCALKPGVVPKDTRKHFQWSVDKKTGALTVLEQQMWIGGENLHVDAHYDPKKNTTTIQRSGKNGFKTTLPGIVLLDMATVKGALVIEFNGTVLSN